MAGTAGSENAERLIAALELKTVPVAMRLTSEAPQDIPQWQGTVPAGCSFWEKAATQTFVTSAPDHELCVIGQYTHNMAEARPAEREDLKDALQAMVGLDYIRDEEVKALPVVRNEIRHVVYGPLSGFPLPPDLVLVFADSRQGLILSEAVQRVDGSTPPAMGRPACAAVPQALNSGAAALSLGCCGARAYLDVMNDETAMWALPGRKFADYCRQVETLAGANRVLTSFHRSRMAAAAAGERPTVKETLAALEK